MRKLVTISIKVLKMKVIVVKKKHQRKMTMKPILKKVRKFTEQFGNYKYRKKRWKPRKLDP